MKDHERLPDSQILVRLILARNRRTPGYAYSVLQNLGRLLPYEPVPAREPAQDAAEVDAATVDVRALIG